MSKRTLAIVAMVVAVVMIIVVDVATGLWKDLVVISGIAAGLVTFGLTVLVIDRVMARSTHERWAPVTQLALGDILHAWADEEATLKSDGGVVPRTLDVLSGSGADAPVTTKRIEQLTVDVSAERRALAASLGTWSSFLAASADVGSVITAAAEIVERLDLIWWELRTLRNVVTAECGGGAVGSSDVATRTAQVNREIVGYNRLVEDLVETLETTLRAHLLGRGAPVTER